ncbi:hypothetical protein LguiB_026937 [Lonicera macranthoides]
MESSKRTMASQAHEGLPPKRPKNSVSHPQTSKALKTNSSSQSEAFVPSQFYCSFSVVFVQSAIVACGVVYAATHSFNVPFLVNLPAWKSFDVDKSGIDEVFRVLTHLYSLPKA